MNHRIWVQIILSGLFVLGLSHIAQAIDNHLIKKIEILGAERTNIDWLYEYLELKAPSVISDYDVEKYSQKLLTTGVYKDVEVYFDVDDPKSNQKVLKIRLDEKWTTIPVVRGEFGGGTPLRVLGVYDTHSFGRLWTLGAESRKYGEAFPGYVIWAHAPRWKKGKHALGFEVWRDRRMRNIYHQSDVLGQLNTETSRFRLLVMFPAFEKFTDTFSDDLQLGIDYEYRKENISQFTYADGLDEVSKVPLKDIGLKLATSVETESYFQLRSVYDNVIRHNSDAHGLRVILKSGAVVTREQSKSISGMEAFYYHLFENQWNFASHFLVQNANSNSISSQVFLGGLDSIRGFPDGYLFGSKAAYGNIELRYVGLKLKKIWMQSVFFYDQGIAANEWDLAKKNIISSGGVGVRLSIPKVYRLMFRIDYGWGLRNSKTRGFTIGLNQFFQPYKPL